MKEKILNDYLLKQQKIDIEKVMDDFYSYVYIIARNSVSTCITEEDIEEIVSDVFVGIWKNSSQLLPTTPVKPYLAGITRNVVRNKYRKSEKNFSISDYEESLTDNNNLEEYVEESEQNKVIREPLKTLKEEEYKIFMMFYYEAKPIKDIAKILELSVSKVKVVLHRVRKIIKLNLENGGYGYGK